MRKSPIGLMQRIAAGRGVLSARAQQIGKNLVYTPLPRYILGFIQAFWKFPRTLTLEVELSRGHKGS